MNGDPEDFGTSANCEIAQLDTERPSPVAIAVLWAAGAVVIMLGVALLLAGISVLIGGHYWWLRS